MIYRTIHKTIYDYSQPVSLCHNLAHLTPRKAPRQDLLESKLLISPQPTITSARQDYFGNSATFFTIHERHQRLEVIADHVVRVEPQSPPYAMATPPWEEARRLLREDRSVEGLDAYQFCFDSTLVKTTETLRDYAASSFTSERPWLDAVLDLTARIYTDFRYDSTATTVATPLEEVFTNRRGVCQDFAHLEIGCLRAMGLAARYVSGYLETDPPPGEVRLIGADASHAWLSVYCHGVGWVDVDPTNNHMPSDKHIIVAWGRDYDDVCPIKGVILGGGKHSVAVEVDVISLGEQFVE